MKQLKNYLGQLMNIDHRSVLQSLILMKLFHACV